MGALGRFPLKEAVKAHSREESWKITDVGVTSMGDQRDNTDLMFHRVGLRVGFDELQRASSRGLSYSCGTEWEFTLRPQSVRTSCQALSRFPRH